jgi:hypothetical protein
MSMASQAQPKKANPALKTEPTPYRHHWAPFTSTKGVACQFFPAKLWMTHNVAIRLADVYVSAFNIYVAADQAGNTQTVDALLRGEFDAKTLADYAPLVEAAQSDFLKRRGGSSGPVNPLRKEHLKVLPAVGILRTLIDELVEAGDVPEEAKGIATTDIIDACYKRYGKGGAFMPLVLFKMKPKPKTGLGTWLADHQRHPYSDVGLALAPEGLHISLLSPKDSRKKVMSPKGRWRGWYIDQQDFLGGKPPIRWLLPMDQVLEPGFAETLWHALKGLRLQLRTVALDESLVPNLTPQAQLAAQAFREWIQERCTESKIGFDLLATVASERKDCLSFLEGTGPIDASLRLAIMGEAGLECPHCHATLLVATNPLTGIPVADVADCDNCHQTWQVGFLLAEKARLQGAMLWAREDGYSCS